jgi:hypothetical protein
MKKSLAIFAFAGLIGVAACSGGADNAEVNADTTAIPAAEPVPSDTLAAPMATDTGAMGGMGADTGAMADTTAADTAM